MDVVVKGRNVEIPEHFRTHVTEKLARTERYDPKIIRVDVELSHETNRRQSKTCQRVQITLISRGPAIRAEASADSFYAALDAAVTKLETRLRRSADRRHHRQHDRLPVGVAAAEVSAGAVPGLADIATFDAVNGVALADETSDEAADQQEQDGPGRIVRVKDHPAEPITVDQALFQMELVGHDFYLFNDSDTQLPSVVYRRKGFDYGLLRLSS